MRKRFLYSNNAVLIRIIYPKVLLQRKSSMKAVIGEWKPTRWINFYYRAAWWKQYPYKTIKIYIAVVCRSISITQFNFYILANLKYVLFNGNKSWWLPLAVSISGFFALMCLNYRKRKHSTYISTHPWEKSGRLWIWYTKRIIGFIDRWRIYSQKFAYYNDAYFNMKLLSHSFIFMKVE